MTGLRYIDGGGQKYPGNGGGELEFLPFSDAVSAKGNVFIQMGIDVASHEVLLLFSELVRNLSLQLYLYYEIKWLEKREIDLDPSHHHLLLGLGMLYG